MEEGFVGFGFAVAAGCDPAAVADPGVGAFDWPAVAAERVAGCEDAFAAAAHFAGRLVGGDLLARPAAVADAGLDPALAQRLLELA